MTKRVFQSPKGVKDILPDEQKYWHYIEQTVKRISEIYNYTHLSLPIFEETPLFQRGIGDATDIVEKEMYTFLDKGDNSLTLRPEFTAGVIRSYLQNGMASLPTPVKLWSMGPVFRYERPQAGRYRQFHQFNAEALGDLDPALDFEVMSIAWQLYDMLGFKNLSFQVNSIGCPNCRPQYLQRITTYYQNHLNEICEDCQKRLIKNPLRLLDCKENPCQPIIEKAPSSIESLCEECNTHFKSLLHYLDDTKRSYTLNPKLVRGLDYYTKTVFEVWVEGIGAQNAVCGGGRYDGLVEVLGGPATPAVGFAAGLERIVLALQQQQCSVPEIKKPIVYFACMGDAAIRKSVSLVSILRVAGVECIMGYGNRSLKAQLREANKREVIYVAILGDEEVASGQVMIKDMVKGSQVAVSWDQLQSYFRETGVPD